MRNWTGVWLSITLVHPEQLCVFVFFTKKLNSKCAPVLFITWSSSRSPSSPWRGRTAGSWPVWTHWWARRASRLSTWSRGGSTAFECAPSTSTASASPQSPAGPSCWPSLEVRARRAPATSGEVQSRWRSVCLLPLGSSARFCCLGENQFTLKCERGIIICVYRVKGWICFSHSGGSMSSV